MKKLLTNTLAAAILAVPLATGLVPEVTGLGITEAQACTINCNQPVGVRRGQKVPVWEVKYCVVGNPGNYKKVDCKSKRAVHTMPNGKRGVCFIGTDNKVHWDRQREVHVGRPFINRKRPRGWIVDWQDERPY